MTGQLVLAMCISTTEKSYSCLSGRMAWGDEGNMRWNTQRSWKFGNNLRISGIGKNTWRERHVVALKLAWTLSCTGYCTIEGEQ